MVISCTGFSGISLNAKLSEFTELWFYLLFYTGAFLLGLTNSVLADAMFMFSNEPQVTPKLFQILFVPLHVTSTPQPQLPRDPHVATQYSDKAVGLTTEEPGSTQGQASGSSLHRFPPASGCRTSSCAAGSRGLPREGKHIAHFHLVRGLRSHRPVAPSRAS